MTTDDDAASEMKQVKRRNSHLQRSSTQEHPNVLEFLQSLEALRQMMRCPGFPPGPPGTGPENFTVEAS